MSTLKADTIQSTSGGAATLTKQTAAKHLCVFDGTGTAAVDESFNNSSLTDNGTGRYAVTVTNAFTNLHFALTGSTVGNEQAFTYINTHSAKKTASTAAFRCVQYDGSFFDMDTVDIVSHGDLA
tara:strand:- start:817 stop:1188 length:372 start_codon:yes stop_codon:yes gene_type:complete